MPSVSPLDPIFRPYKRIGAPIVGATPGAITAPPPPPDMVLIYNTALSADPKTISMTFSGTVNCLVDWGDATSDAYTTTGSKSHTYASAGTYTVTISGTLGGFANGGTAAQRNRLIEVVSWGDALGLTSLAYACYDSSVSAVPDAIPPTVVNINSIFYQAATFNQSLNGWDTSAITDMGYAFSEAAAFNGDISGWDTSGVTDINSMFRFASAFNQDISGWNTASVTDMSALFYGANAFNQPIGGWDVSSVTNMGDVFAEATSFNGNIGAWDTSSATFMGAMFYQASAFNQDIGNWDTALVTNMAFMFSGCSVFNRDLSGWCVTLIGSAPSNFRSFTPAWVLPKPVWGTCPP